MSPEVIVLELVGLIIRVLPGFLALFTGAKTDEEAMSRAVVAVRALRKNPAATAIDDYEARNMRADEPTGRVDVGKPPR